MVQPYLKLYYFFKHSTSIVVYIERILLYGRIWYVYNIVLINIYRSYYTKNNNINIRESLSDSQTSRITIDKEQLCSKT